MKHSFLPIKKNICNHCKIQLLLFIQTWIAFLDQKVIYPNVLKDEDPEHTVELDPDVEHTDNLKKYETNLARNDNNYRNRAKQKMKSEIYNKSVRLVSSASNSNQSVDATVSS